RGRHPVVAVDAHVMARPRRARRGLGRHVYTLMILPAAVTILLIIAFPLVYTLWMALHEYSMGAAGTPPFVGLANYLELLKTQRCLEAIPRTFLFTLIGVLGPTVLGTAAALVFARSFPGRGLLRTIFSLPMMATPVSIALIWQMMFHPQLGILNYLLSLVGIGPQPWIFSRTSVLPSLALVETWQWTPFVMLIVLGGLAALPTEPYEAARIDAASRWQVLRYVALPLVWPYLMVAILLRAIGAPRTVHIIYVVTH